MSFEHVEASLPKIARSVEEQLPKGWGFILIATNFGSTGGKDTSYVSNVARESARELLRAFLELWDESDFGE